MQMMVSNISSGITNLNQVFKLIFTIAREGSIRPVGARNDIRHIPYMYELTISLPGKFTIIASAPMMGMVNTAMPEVDCINNENKM